MKQLGKKLHTPSLTNELSLKTLVENRTVHTLSNCELNLFETYQESQLVPLKFNDLVVTSMLRGKKIMHLFDEPGFDYVPGETVIIPSNVEMKIDFPEATTNNPTQCLALAIDHHKIQSTLDLLNEKYPKEGVNNYWNLDQNDYFFYNNEDLANTMNKLIGVCMSSALTKDVLADLTLQELLVYIIQSQTNNAIESGKIHANDNALSHVIKYIRERLGDRLTMKELTNTACMSQASFYRYFKREIGMSPVEFILHERIKYAKSLLKNPNILINQVCFESGFDDCNYFIRVFKKIEGITPKQYQQCFIIQ
ncbi:MAG: AraC family transcriptional regulator [Fluviicola sp.]|nr:AraC family transcriptional regulator [Fluviicola sp.]